MATDQVIGAEQVVALRERRVGKASEELVRLARQAGFTVGATGPGTFRLIRSYRPRWVIPLAVLLVPLLGLGFFVLLVRRDEQAIITIFEDRSGVKARVVGSAPRSLLDALREVEGSFAEVEPIQAPPLVSSPAPAPRLAARPAISGAVPVADPEDMDEATVIRPQRVTDTVARLVLADGRAVPVGSGVVIGRDPDGATHGAALGMALADPSLSKTHVLVRLAPDGVAVTDLHSTNGTNIRIGERLVPCAPGSAVTAPFGSTILAGDSAIRVAP